MGVFNFLGGHSISWRVCRVWHPTPPPCGGVTLCPVEPELFCMQYSFGSVAAASQLLSQIGAMLRPGGVVRHGARRRRRRATDTSGAIGVAPRTQVAQSLKCVVTEVWRHGRHGHEWRTARGVT